MANHKQALKRHRQSLKRHVRNMDRKSRMRNIIRHFKAELTANNLDKAKELLPQAVKTIQRTASAGVIHKRNASRRVSRLVRALNKASAD